MATFEQYIGEDFYFTLKRQRENLTYYDLTNDFLDIIIYVYQGNTIIKFSKTLKEGYEQLVNVDDYTYKMIFSSDLSAQMKSGINCISIDFINTDGTYDDSRRNRKKETEFINMLNNVTVNER